MSLLAKMKEYRSLSNKQTTDISHPELPALPVSEPSLRLSKSPLQVAISGLLAAFPIPAVAYKLLPGDVGKRVYELTEGDPEEAHRFVAEIHERLGALLAADRETGYGLPITADAATIGPNAVSRDDQIREEHAHGRADEVLSGEVSESAAVTDR